MHTLLLTTDTAADAKLLAEFLSKMKTVKSVTIDPTVEEEPEWQNPLRVFTNEEHEHLLKEAEASPIMSARYAERYSESLIKKWSRKK
jgi:hypothetical protein